MDEIKIMRHLAEMERMHMNFEQFVKEKQSHFENMT